MSIPCLFVKVQNSPIVINSVTAGCEWVQYPYPGCTVSRMRDGATCMFEGGKLYRRLRRENGAWEWAEVEEYDPRVESYDGYTNPFWNAWQHWKVNGDFPDGTYELCGPSFNGNPEDFHVDTFIRHGIESVTLLDHSYENIEKFLREYDATGYVEGLVFTSTTGERKAKIRRIDFGLQWPMPIKDARGPYDVQLRKRSGSYGRNES